MQNSPLPDDLAHPRRDRASLIANLATGSALLVALAVVTAAALFVR